MRKARREHTGSKRTAAIGLAVITLGSLCFIAAMYVLVVALKLVAG